MFGTYQQPLESAPVVYGITIPAKTWNPVKIDFMLWGGDCKIYGFSLFTIFSVMTYTTLMEGKYAFGWLATRLSLAAGILWFYGGNWFGFNAYVPFIGVALLSYYAFSIVASWIAISGGYDDEISLTTNQATG